MRVLIISHNVLCKTSNMGRTLSSYFRAFGADEVAQIYIHNEVPTDNSVCRRYYRFTDTDAVRSILDRRVHGSIFEEKDIATDRVSSRTDEGSVRRLYQLGRKRSGWIILSRNLVWKLSHWKSPTLDKWILEFAPDILFFMNGDYTFTYDIALYVKKLTLKPLVACCVDDFYDNNRNEKSMIGRISYRLFMKKVCALMDHTSCIFTICDSMAEVYAKQFKKRCRTLYSSVDAVELSPNPCARHISYIGNLGLGRHKQIVAIGRAIRSLHRSEEPRMLDVYSAESRGEILETMTEENGIRFHGMISADEVLRVMYNSMAVVHTESFDSVFQKRVRYSFSTKIAESLMYGPCLTAYGPKGIESIEYLEKNQAAFVITDAAKLAEGISLLISDGALRKEIVDNARRTALQNHTAERVSRIFREELERIIGGN